MLIQKQLTQLFKDYYEAIASSQEPVKGKILNNNFILSFINIGMGIKLSSFVKSVHKYSLINQFLAFL